MVYGPLEAEDMAMQEWLNSVNTLKNAAPSPTPQFSLPPAMPQAPMAMPSPVQQAASRIPSYDSAAMGDRLASEQARVRQELLGAYTPPKIGWQNAIIQSLAGLAPSLIASAVLDSGKYASIIGKAGSQGLADVGKLQTDYSNNLVKGQLAASEFDVGNLSQMQREKQALDVADLQGQYQLERAKQGGSFGSQIINDISEATRVKNLTGYEGPAEDLIGTTEKMTMDRVNRDVRVQMQEDNLKRRDASLGLADRGMDVTEAKAAGETLKAPPEPFREKISSAISMQTKLAPIMDLLEKGGDSLLDAASWKAQTLIPGSTPQLIDGTLQLLAADIRNSKEAGVMTDQDFRRYATALDGLVYAPPAAKAQGMKILLRDIQTKTKTDLETAKASKINVSALEALIQNQNTPAQQDIFVQRGGQAANNADNSKLFTGGQDRKSQLMAMTPEQRAALKAELKAKLGR